jgi:hypothetical protein
MKADAVTQCLATIYLSLAGACGGDEVLRRANAAIRGALDDQAFREPAAAAAMRGVLRGAETHLGRPARHNGAPADNVVPFRRRTPDAA